MKNGELLGDCFQPPSVFVAIADEESVAIAHSHLLNEARQLILLRAMQKSRLGDAAQGETDLAATRNAQADIDLKAIRACAAMSRARTSSSSGATQPGGLTPCQHSPESWLPFALT